VVLVADPQMSANLFRRHTYPALRKVLWVILLIRGCPNGIFAYLLTREAGRAKNQARAQERETTGARHMASAPPTDLKSLITP